MDSLSHNCFSWIGLIGPQSQAADAFAINFILVLSLAIPLIASDYGPIGPQKTKATRSNCEAVGQSKPISFLLDWRKYTLRSPC